MWRACGLLAACCAPLAALLVFLMTETGTPSEADVTVSFASAEGLVPGKTLVRYRGVEIGRLTALNMSTDRTRVLATVLLDIAAARFTTCDARFWIVRPSVELTGMSRLDTAFSGSYIGVDIGRASRQCRVFDGHETVPVVPYGSSGTRFVLHAASMGSLAAGSPVYFKQMRVGSVLDASLSARGDGVDLSAWIGSPFDRYVTASTRWWHASGIDARLGSGGIRMDIASPSAVWSGGIAFETPVPSGELSRRLPDREPFTLFATRADALRRADDGPAASVRMRFAASAQGLSVGAPVDFHGVEIGEVTAVAVELDRALQRTDMIVTLDLYPARLGETYRRALGGGDSAAGRNLLHQLVAQGLCGQLRIGNQLTAQRYIALEFFPHAAPANVDTSHVLVELPTVPNALETLREQVVDIGDRIGRIPLAEIGRRVDETSRSADSFFRQVNDELAPALKKSAMPWRASREGRRGADE
ncbi:mammalian cell entry protein [Burkholderia ubonensis]|uniref:PqiB family protein n=2 Tax=Burkholderia ubonensis TaxID=101571 RepID=UPI0007593880|nr:MlaD family protein [Burkholderia ubonensis]KVG74443.1 mammalian cell entry protein [Burkholderia ubonensis]KVH25025.1 mammalian cell entry protein [Burkholderia ubonensis]KVH51804.1 mammalian cell entry protein [Burkholderia ubonensis]KVH86024.1 mammalian cell entry protein [Burkholderia ubonensis]KVM32104.1 mammalian cell entry protein [Burkholderia ubonensis]